MAYIGVTANVVGNPSIPRNARAKVQHAPDAITALSGSVTAQTAVTADITAALLVTTTSDTDKTAVNVDVTAALANVTIAGDSTALGLVTQIQTDMVTLATDIATLATAVTLIRTDFATLKTAAGSAPTADVCVYFNPATVITKNMLKLCLDDIIKMVNFGSGDLS